MKPLHAVLLIVAVVAGIALCYSGAFYQTGTQWYHSCWMRHNGTVKSAQSPEQAAEWAKCESTADDALYGAGFIQAGNPEYAATPQLKAIQAACPNGYSEMMIDGWWINAVQMIQEDGGPRFGDHLLPAGDMIVRTFTNRWPRCSAARGANGFPKLVRRGGKFDWASPCEPCKAEEAAIAKANAERAAWDALTDKEREKQVDKWLSDASQNDYKDLRERAKEAK